MDEKKEFLGRGWAYPPSLDPLTGAVEFAEFEDDVRQAVFIILGTAPGERLMRPDFGCGIYDMVFEVIDASTLTRVVNLVTEALMRYEPRISLTGVDVDPLFASEGRLEVTVKYLVRSTNQVGNLVFPFYFGEGGRP
ncbi:GPW/gp25 family protein [Paraburkholderia sp. SIMBA_054]|uniref:GPW/gp25 family protein n=1 Tax=Paraburkholderia sp. SIMBA_054 TaxID=3085795 RepID=UPI003979D783